ncbi:MAG: hypothetical protein H5T69_11860, partial [Chloroflexi bacterium]|nr:hypothetical protein [Chloroflexota bacterium]
MISFLPETVPVSLVLPTLLALVLLIGWAMAGRLASLNIGNPLERFLLFILLGVTAISWVGALLAALNWFRPWILFPVLALVGLGRWLTARQYHSLAAGNEDAKQTDGLPAQILKTEKPIPWFAQVLLIAIFIGAGWLYGHPAETFNLSDDSAVYTIGGIVLARDGSLFFRPPSVYDFASLTPIKPDAEQTIQSWEPQEDFVQQFSFTDLLASAWTRHLGPFYQWSLEDGRLEIGFLPFPKVWAALAVWFFGPARAIWAAPLFGLLGLFSLFGLLRRSVGWAPALAAVALLAGILPQVWYARVMLSEIFAQTVLIGGLYLAALAHKKATQGSPFADDLAAWSAL